MGGEIEKAKGYVLDGKHFDTLAEAKEYKFEQGIQDIINDAIRRFDVDHEGDEIIREFLGSYFHGIHNRVNALRKEVFARTKKDVKAEPESKEANDNLVLAK